MEFSALLGMVIFIKYIAIFRSLRELSVFWKVYGHLFAVIRFWFLEHPNAWTKFFVVIYSAIRRFLLGIEYFLTLLNPLFPRVPVLTVVKYGVKNASWPGAAGVCRSRLGSVFSWLWVWGIVPLPRRLGKSFLLGRRINFSRAYSKNKGRRSSTICSTATECPPPSTRFHGQSGFRHSAGTLCRYLYFGKKPGSPLYFPELFSRLDCVS